MEAPQGVSALLGVMETRNSSFVNMLEPLLKIAYNSTSVNQALGRLGAASMVAGGCLG